MRNKYKEWDIRYDKLAPVVLKNLEKRHYEAYYCKTKEEALEKALELIPEEHSVGWGGSATCEGIGLQDALRKRGNPLIDRDLAKTPEERVEIMRQALLSDTFIGSTNAMSEDGELVNLDGNGNRVAAMIFGPKQVVLVVGMNKVTKNLDEAIARVRHHAAPTRVQSFPDLNPPCATTGSCIDCTSADSVCCYMSIIRMSRPAKKIKIILIGEDIGF